MIKILIADHLHKNIPTDFSFARLISMRKLSQREISRARDLGINRFYLPTLDASQTDKFYKELDEFWDEVIKPFPSDHPFWRNLVSGKIQEWERSAVYFIVTLFTLEEIKNQKDLELIFIAGSVEEEDVLRDWANKKNWVIKEWSEKLPQWFRKIKQEIRNYLIYIWFFTIALQKKFKLPSFRSFPKNNKEKETVLIASLFYPKSFKDGKYRDPFFSDLHNFFEKQGKRCMYIEDCLSMPSGALSKTISICNDVIINVPYALLSWRKMFLCFLRVFFRTFKLDRALFMGCDFSKLIQWNLRRSLNGFNLSSELFFEGVSSLCQKEHFDRMIFLFEGNVFERAWIQAFRKYGTNNIDAYSHAVIFPLLSLKIYLTEKEKNIRPEPDRYICSGPYGKKLLAKVGRRPVDKMLNGCTLRKVPDLSQEKVGQNKTRNILVALDGMWSSSYLLDWLIENKEVFKDFEVFVRAHPNVPIEEVCKRCLYTLPDNFKLSKDELKDDILKSFCVIYRHTSVGMQGLLNGIPAIHLAVDSPLKGDPIEELTFGKWVVQNSVELKKAIEEIMSLKESQMSKIWEDSKEFSDNYFAIPIGEALNDFS